LDEITALPIDSAVAGDPSIMKYSTYTDEAVVSALNSIVSSAANAAANGASASSGTSTSETATRVVSVERKSSIGSASGPSGDFAIVGVNVDNGGQSISITRLVSSAEADASK
jgi:hypothetical protein